jgi:hypothetical protein
VINISKFFQIGWDFVVRIETLFSLIAAIFAALAYYNSADNTGWQRPL